MLLLFWVWIFGIQYYHLGEIGFNEDRVYECFSSVLLDGIDLGLKILHVFTVFCIPLL